MEADGTVEVVADGAAADAKALVVAMATSVVAGAGALAVIVFAVVDGPGRHARGLLVTLALVAVLGVATAWVRVAATLAGRPPVRSVGSAGPVGSVGPPGSASGAPVDDAGGAAPIE